MTIENARNMKPFSTGENAPKMGSSVNPVRRAKMRGKQAESGKPVPLIFDPFSTGENSGMPVVPVPLTPT